MYVKNFEVRWSDIDANRHMANSAYVNFAGHTRMGFFEELGLTLTKLEEYHLGPVVFYEHIYYFKEILPGTPVRVTLELTGLADDGRFFEFRHNFYDGKGMHMAHCEMMGAWNDMRHRKLTGLPEDLLSKFDAVKSMDEFRILTKEDTRKFAKQPKNLV